MKAQIREIRKRDGKAVPFERERIRAAIEKGLHAAEGKKVPDFLLKKDSENYTDVVIARLEGKYRATAPSVEQIQREVIEVLFMMGRHEASELYRIYMHGKEALRAGEITPEQFAPDGVSREAVNRVIEWNRVHKCATIEELNVLIRSENRAGKGVWERAQIPRRKGHVLTFLDLVRASEEQSNKEAREAAQIALGKEGLRVMIVAGPSSSGKTTTTNKTCRSIGEISKGKVKFKGLEVDRFFDSFENYERTGRKVTYRIDGKEYPDYDFETPWAYRLEVYANVLGRILAGEEVMLPKYLFGKGMYVENDISFQLLPGEVLVLDCLHGLSPYICGTLNPETTFKLYIESMNTVLGPEGYIRWTDIRLISRALRDKVHRGHDPLLTLLHWHLVRNGDSVGILPYILTADVIVNGGLAYMLPLFKPMIYKILRDIVPILARNPDAHDALVRAVRIINLLDEVEDLRPDLHHEYVKPGGIIPGDSIFREFGGGSTVVH